MWYPKSELVKKAREIAKEKYPKGFNKKKLIECSKEVYGGYGVNPHKPINTMDDVDNKSNYFSEIDGHYPRGMSGCETVGISGGCGNECPVFLDGECKNVDKDMAESIIEYISDFDKEQFDTIIDSYSVVNEMYKLHKKQCH